MDPFLGLSFVLMGIGISLFISLAISLQYTQQSYIAVQVLARLQPTGSIAIFCNALVTQLQ